MLRGKNVELAVSFFDITVHPLALAIFARVKTKVFPSDFCGLKSFLYLVQKTKNLPFGASRDEIHKSAFTRVETAKRNKEILPAALLFVKMRGQDEAAAIGVMLEKVTVWSAIANQQDFTVAITARTARAVNF